MSGADRAVRIKARMGSGVDGVVATPDGFPAFVTRPDFVPHESHGFPEFIEGCDAVAMGRTTFLPALGAPSWPWGSMPVYVLTSTPLPEGSPSQVVAVSGGAGALVDALRGRGSTGDVHLVGGPRTVAAVHAVGALDLLEVVVLPVVLGGGLRLWPPGGAPVGLALEAPPRVFPDGSVSLRCVPD